MDKNASVRQHLFSIKTKNIVSKTSTTTESVRMKRMQLNTDKWNQWKYEAAPNSKRKRLYNHFRFSQRLQFSMFSKESTKCVSMKLCFQTKKNQMVLNKR